MITRKINLGFLFLLVVVGCYGQIGDAIPVATFSEIIVNIDLPQYRALRADGGFVDVDGGVKGIVVYREDAGKFIAFERNCTYKPEESCARVEPDISRLFLVDKCCGSNFGFSDGYPTRGPASRALRKYRTHFSGTTLTITDEIVY